jgi:16S rRNA (guanine527-N7)-methyltransferase
MSPHNLVSRAARDELWERHIPECVGVARLLPAGAGRLLDVGSGGGFPGMVLAIMRADLEVHLLDATRKKTDFLREAAATLGVSVTVHTGRAEELQQGPLGASFDIVTARAVAPLERLLGWTIPFLRPGGVLYAIKGARWAEELEAAGPELRRIGAGLVATPDDTSAPEQPAAASGPPSVSPSVVILRRER